MNAKFWVKLSNIIGIIGIILLIYWVFFFVVNEVVELNVLQKYIATDTFISNIWGILALIFGSALISLMFNLTRIVEKSDGELSKSSKKFSKKWIAIIILGFPVILALLYGNGYLHSEKDKNLLIASVKSVVESNSSVTDSLTNYSFTKEWINEAKNFLDIYSEIDNRIGATTIIVVDTLENFQVFLGFSYDNIVDTIAPKKDYIRKTTAEERDYLNDIFFNKKDYVRYGYNKSEWKYELFYPYSKNGKTIVLDVDEGN